MKKFLLTTAAAATVLAGSAFAGGKQAVYSKGSVGCCNTVMPFVGLAGGWVYNGHDNFDVIHEDGHKGRSRGLESNWGFRGEVGVELKMRNNIGVIVGLDGGYYGYYRYKPIYNNADTGGTAGVDDVDFDVVGYSVFAGLSSYNWESLSFNVLGGFMLTRVAPLGHHSYDVISPSGTVKPHTDAMFMSKTLDVQPLVRFELGYGYGDFLVLLSWTHVFSLHAGDEGDSLALTRSAGAPIHTGHSTNGDALGAGVAPAMDVVFLGVRLFWGNFM